MSYYWLNVALCYQSMNVGVFNLKGADGIRMS